MTSYPFESVGSALWPSPTSIEYQAYVRNAAATAGDVLQQDYHASDTLPSGNAYVAGGEDIRSADHIMANVIAPDALGVGSVAGPYFGVAVRSVAENSLVRLCMFGYCSAFVIASAGSTAIGDPLGTTTAKNLDLVPVTGERIIAQAQAVVTTPTTRALGAVLLNGIGTFCTGIA